MQSKAKRGRPRAADPRMIARVALDLFVARGFDQVTMSEIAEAASVSRRTLFRLFPSKSDLVWDGLQSVREVVRERAAALAGVDLAPSQVMGELAEPFLRQLDEPAAAETARERLRLLGRVPALFDHPPLREIEVIVASMLAARGASTGAASPMLVARALVATTFAALMWWAEDGEGMSALEATQAAFRALGRVEEGEA